MIQAERIFTELFRFEFYLCSICRVHHICNLDDWLVQFTPEQLFQLYQAQVRSCMDYGLLLSPLGWFGKRLTSGPGLDWKLSPEAHQWPCLDKRQAADSWTSAKASSLVGILQNTCWRVCDAITRPNCTIHFPPSGLEARVITLLTCYLYATLSSRRVVFPIIMTWMSCHFFERPEWIGYF